MKDTLKLVFLLLLLSLASAASLTGQSGGDCFSLRLSSHTAEPGATVCVDVSVHGFVDMLGMQYSLKWDNTKLGFVSTSNLNLQGLDFGVFNNNTMTAAWVDSDVQGETLADGTVIYSICFQVLAPAGSSENIWFSNEPTPVEFLRRSPGSFNFNTVDHYTLIGSNIVSSFGTETPFSVESACIQPGNCQTGSGFQAILSAGAPDYQWSWDGVIAGTTSDPEVNDVIAPGLYELNISDANGEDVLVLVGAGNSDLEIADYSLTPVSCGNTAGSISINAVNGASGNLDYLWSTGEETASIAVASPGSYSVTISDEAGCSVEAVFEVPIQSTFTVSETILSPACDNVSVGAINLDVSPAANYTFLWSNNAVSQNITGITTGAYSVTVTDASTGCEVVESYNVTATGLGIAFSFSGCEVPNGSISILAWPFGGEGPFNYLWNTGETTSTIEVPYVQGNIYSVTVTDINGCTESASQALNCVSGQATLRIAGASVVPGESFCLDAAISNSVPVSAIALEYSWDENILQFDSITNLQMPDPQLAGWSLNGPGELDFLWTGNTTPFATNAHPVSLMEVCFTALQPGNTQVDFSTDPTETYLLTGSGVQNLALFTTGGAVIVSGNSQHEIGVRGTEVLVNQLAQACIEVKATNFENVSQLSYNLIWDANQLEFASILNINPSTELMLVDFNTSLVSGGWLGLNWQAAPGESMTLSNDATLYEVCFNAIGVPGTYSVGFNNEQAQRANGLELGVESIDGAVVIKDAGLSNHVSLSLAPGAVINAGQDTCIAVRVEQFENIFAAQFSIVWDPSIVRLDSVLPAQLPGLSTTSNFGYFPTQGILTFSWLDPSLTNGATVAAGASLYDLCFSAFGPIGVTSVNFENAPTAIEFVDNSNEVIPFIGQGGFFVVPDQNVWPGDTDNNGHVNHFDLLPLGIGFGATGPQRPDASIDWIGQAAEDWTQYTPTSVVNYKHIDTNGDGIIGDIDTQAIVQNWGLSVNPFAPETPIFEPRELGIPLFVQADTLAPSEVAALDIILGTTDLPAEDVYGIAFSITYNPELIVPGSVSASFLDSWMGEENNNLISIFRVAPSQDRIDIALSRTDGSNISGLGSIGKLHITIEDVIFRNSVFRRAEFDIQNVRLINRDEVDIPVAPEMSTSWVSVSTGTNNPELANQILLYPTPASDLVLLSTKGLQVNRVQLLDPFGRTAADFVAPNNGLDVSQLAAGIYLARITTDRGVAYKPLIIAH